MACAGLAVALCGGGGRQPRGQRFTGDRAARSQVGGLGHPAVGLAAGDAEPVGQDEAEFAAQLSRTGVLDELIDQRVAGHREPPSFLLEPFQQRKPLRGGQCVIRMPCDAGHHGAQRIEVLLNLLATNRTHARIVSDCTDTKRGRQATETEVAQVI